jgi:hypothetical protein
MNRDEVEWVREAFASGSAARLRLLTDHTVFDCGEAAGTSGAAWWKFEHGDSITAYRAESLYAVLRRLRNGERLGAGTEAEPTGAAPAVEDEAIKRTHHEIALLVAAENLMNLSSAELVKAAPTWESEMVRETRAVARRILRKRIFELGGEAPAEDDTGRG